MPTRRRDVIYLGAAILLVAALNFVGLLRYPGGPLREPSADGPLWLDMRPADQGSATVGNSQPSDWAQVGIPLYFGMLTLHNPWPWAASVEDVVPVDLTPGLRLEAVWVSRPGSPSGPTIAIGPLSSLPPDYSLGQAFTHLPAMVEPSGDGHERDARTLLVVRAERPGQLGFAALAVDYRVGPMTFHAVEHLALHACIGPLPSGFTCPAA